MARPRITLDVASFTRSLQYRLDNATPQERPVLCGIIEQALFQSNNYNGFMYRNGYRPNDPTFDENERMYFLP
jgi:hypothetical protein